MSLISLEEKNLGPILQPTTRGFLFWGALMSLIFTNSQWGDTWKVFYCQTWACYHVTLFIFFKTVCFVRCARAIISHRTVFILLWPKIEGPSKQEENSKPKSGTTNPKISNTYWVIKHLKNLRVRVAVFVNMIYFSFINIICLFYFT